MSVTDVLATADKSLFLDAKSKAVKTPEEQKAETFAALMAEKIAADQPARAAKEERIAKHNAAVMATMAAVPDVRQEFKDYMEMTPAERMRQQILQSLGITEEELADMTPEERKAVEQKIADTIKDMAHEQVERNGHSKDAVEGDDVAS